MDEPTKDTINFGDYAVIDGVEYEFAKLPGVTWTVKPVTSEDELKRSRFMMHNRILETEGTRYEMPPTAVEIRNYEVALLCGGTNLKRNNGKPALSDKAGLKEIQTLVGSMPPEMVNEIWVKIGQVYPKWGPSDPNDWQEKAETETN